MILLLESCGVPSSVVQLWIQKCRLTGVGDPDTLPKHVLGIEPYPGRPGHFVVLSNDYDKVPDDVLHSATRVVEDGLVVKDRYAPADHVPKYRKRGTV